VTGPGILDAWWLPLLAAPFAGSLLGVLIRRLPEGRPVLIARSACEACGARLRARDLVPLLSFAWLRGRCAACGARIGAFHPAVELAAVAVAACAVVAGGGTAMVWCGCALGWTLLALGWIDLEHMILPDALTLPLILGGLFATWWLDPEAVADHAIGAAAGYLVLRGVGLAYRALRGREGIGQGDAKLLAAAGAWAGWAALSPIVLIAALGGIAAALVLRLRGRQVEATTALPFGPALALALWLVWLYAAAQAGMAPEEWGGFG
jgi:leader peptidase (prepilin peptidase)/N-methyltransferase